MAQKVLITGGSGSIGRKLSNLLLAKGFEVAWLSRKSGSFGKIKVYKWDIQKHFIEEEAFEDLDYVIHLAGAGIAEARWTKARKKEIIDSRVESTKLLFAYAKRLNIPLKAFISSSAIGYYGGDTGNIVQDEFSKTGNDFMAKVCKSWEDAGLQFSEYGFRVVYIRTGIVLDAESGALAKLAMPIQLGMGTYLGTGNQWMSWIHHEDLCEIYLKAIEDESFVGAFNAVAPNPVTNKVFSKTLASHLKRWILPLYIPGFLFKILFGEMAVVVTGSSHVLCRRLSETDFRFKFRTLEEALKELYK